jgi:hypothetical protein
LFRLAVILLVSKKKAGMAPTAYPPGALKGPFELRLLSIAGIAPKPVKWE